MQLNDSIEKNIAIAPDSLKANEVPVVRVEPSKGWFSLNLHYLWQYCELFFFLSWHDSKERYKQNVWEQHGLLSSPFLQ